MVYNTVVDQTQTMLSALLVDAMERSGISIKDISINVDITYEHARRIIRGEAIPSRFALKEVCDFLGVDFKAADKLATADKIRKKFGTIPLELSGKKPSLEALERVWDYLTEAQQEDLTTMAQSFAKRNRSNGAT